MASPGVCWSVTDQLSCQPQSILEMVPNCQCRYMHLCSPLHNSFFFQVFAHAQKMLSFTLTLCQYARLAHGRFLVLVKLPDMSTIVTGKWERKEWQLIALKSCFIPSQARAKCFIMAIIMSSSIRKNIAHHFPQFFHVVAATAVCCIGLIT